MEGLMFSGKSFFQIINSGGFTMYILLLCSIVSLGVIFERFMYFKKRSRAKRGDFMVKIKDELAKGYIDKALELCKSVKTPFAMVAFSGLYLRGHNEKIISATMEREIVVETTKLEKYTSIVGTIGSTAVYIGLFGTVIGIIRAFHDISLSGSGGISVVIGGISEALICTAAGLLVAVPAVIAYNYFIKRIDGFVSDMELCASEVIDLIGVKQ